MGAADQFHKVGASTATTLSSPGYTIGATSINVASTTNYPTDTGVTVTVDEVDGNGERVVGTRNVFRGDVASATQINELVYAGGDANRNYSAGAGTRVYIEVNEVQMNRLVDGVLVEHNQDGTHGAVTADSLTVDGAATHSSTLTQTGVATFATHIDINDSSTAIRDSSDNELLKFAKTASAVNEIEITNAATGGIPQIAATGGDTNISLYAKAKGTGHFLPGNPVAFLARRTTDQSGIVTATTTKVQFATETYDLGGNFDNATNYNFVAPYDGIYHFSWSTCMDSVGTIYYSMLYINGSLYTSEFRFSNAVTDDLSSGGSCTVQMTAGQTADVRVQHNAGANRSLLGTTAGANYFSGYLVGRT